MTLIDGIAERIGAISYADLPSEAVHWAKTAILGTIGVTLAGAAEPCARIVAGVIGSGAGTGECLIFGSDRRAAPLGAEIRVTFDDGRTIATRVERALGRGPDNKLPEAALFAKFANCAGRALPPDRVELLHRALSRLEQADRMRDVVALIAPSPAR